MKSPSDPRPPDSDGAQDSPDASSQEALEALQRKLAGLGENSMRKTYYPELQERLEELERLKAFLDHSNDAIFLVEVRTGRIVDLNESACRQMGWSRSELLEKSLFDLSDLHDNPAAASLIRSDEDAEVRDLIVTELHRHDGESFWAELTLNRMHFRDRAYVLAVARDITQRRAVEEALRQSEEFLKNIVDHIPAMVFAKDAQQLRFITINKYGEELLGFSRKEILGKRNEDLFPAAQAQFFSCKDRVTLEKGELMEIPEEVITTPSGDRILRTKKIPLLDEQGKSRYLLGIAEDITERRQLEEKLLQSQKMEAIGQLAGGVAHDFNNILMVIMGYGSMLRNDAALAAPHREQVDRIMDAADKAAQLTSGLLTFSRKQVIKTQTVDLNDVIRHVEKFLSRIIGEDVQLRAVQAGHPLPVDIDANQIEQVLVNLATNARDAMPRGGLLTVETSLQRIDAAFVQANGIGEPGPFAVISISDTGVGMDDQTRKRIFEPFFTTKEVGKGTGLGMSIVYGIIKQHSGFVNVYSEPGIGTTFRIYLPLSATSPLAEETLRDLEQPRGGSETILVVEDEADLRTLLEQILAGAGYRVILAADGAAAIEQYARRTSPISLVLMDMIMPGMSGKEACQRIRELDPAARVLYTSGYTMDIIKNRDLIEEGTELLMKPVRPRELLNKVREMLER
ncbi:PAS domain S-box protein [Geomonas nitrogeniifigens]|uniref:histidine kinase n=1 Tax=Geomonas diazotrophica TaxID=2843197 RepID=A0ABX8JP14_9BACT|nr:PAS domain-containing sensor histidine kinase [Geomonas nitrogeniifigens]QWV97170.1 PAS domain S-box protein [Geomonas nitrogeniifigens]QXE86342.1 PAS domain S-box protein [Geomonas nitrogeniifigens]